MFMPAIPAMVPQAGAQTQSCLAHQLHLPLLMRVTWCLQAVNLVDSQFKR